MTTERSERPVIAAFVVAILAALALTVTYTVGGQPQLEGIFLGLALGGIGVGAVVWAQRFMPDEEVAEERPVLASNEEQIAAFTTSFEKGGHSLGRRSLLVKLGLGAVASLALAAVFPIRSLGPRPGRGLKETPYRAGGLRLVTEHGAPIRPRDLRAGTLLTVFPAGAIRDAQAPTLLLRLDEEAQEAFRPRKGREGWTVDGIVAFSKLCTHTGCPVGLYQEELKLLLCPCHQSTFDVLQAAEPVFGPAARPLPQLPLGLDSVGFLIATGDFSDPVGGGFWDRGRGPDRTDGEPDDEAEEEA
ncbi:MAG: Rieske 2Fe-2S domain-containing protein [Acidimicrobiales bacterium]